MAGKTAAGEKYKHLEGLYQRVLQFAVVPHCSKPEAKELRHVIQ